MNESHIPTEGTYDGLFEATHHRMVVLLQGRCDWKHELAANYS